MCVVMIVCIVVYTFCDDFFFFKQKTAYEMRISDWSSDVCSSDLSCEPELSAWPGSVSQGLYRPGPGLVPPVSRQPCPLCLARTSTSRSPTPISPSAAAPVTP